MGTIVKNRHRKQAETWKIHILLTTEVKVAKGTVGIGPNKALSELHCTCSTRICLAVESSPYLHGFMRKRTCK